MSSAETISEEDDLPTIWEKITDPREALRTIVEHQDFLGYDPYYKELRDALLKMAERLSA